MNPAEVYAVATEVVKEAIERRAEIPGAINWGDLGVDSVEEYRSYPDGHTGMRVLIGEADAHNEELHRFISERLQATGLYGVEVVTEW